MTTATKSRPAAKSELQRPEREHAKYQRLIDFCKTLPPTPTAVAHPCDQTSLQGAVDAARMENCKAVFAYEDVENERIGTVPVCLWYPFRNALLEKITAKYGTVSSKTRMATETLARVG